MYRHSSGYGMRYDGIGYSGLVVSPYYDSLLVKYTARGASWEETVRRMRRALQEARIRGVKTNIPFLLNVLTHPEFEKGVVTTSFIDQACDRPHAAPPAPRASRPLPPASPLTPYLSLLPPSRQNPDLLKISGSTWDFASPNQNDQEKVGRIERLMRYLANLAVNGHPVELGANPASLGAAAKMPAPPAKVSEGAPAKGFKQIFDEQGPEALAKAVRANKGTLLTDTTWRDAHQSLLATRMRTNELVNAADASADILSGCFSFEMWGGATFDVAMRFLRECPWDRLEQLREKVPNVPFQMLLRGANAVGYTNYPDNVVYEFCKVAKQKVRRLALNTTTSSTATATTSSTANACATPHRRASTSSGSSIRSTTSRT